MLATQKLAVAAHMHVMLRRKTGRVTDTPNGWRPATSMRGPSSPSPASSRAIPTRRGMWGIQ